MNLLIYFPNVHILENNGREISGSLHADFSEERPDGSCAEKRGKAEFRAAGRIFSEVCALGVPSAGVLSTVSVRSTLSCGHV